MPEQDNAPEAEAPPIPAAFIPASPGWQAVYSGDNGVAVYKDVAFWAVRGDRIPGAWVGTVGGLRPAASALGNFVGIKGPAEDVSQWNQTVASLAAVLAAPEEAASQLLQEELKDTTPVEAPLEDKKTHRLTGTISGIVADNVVQIFPDDGGPVGEYRNFGVAGVEIAPGIRVSVFDTPGGLLLEPAPR